MPELKTKLNNASVEKFLKGVADTKKREDSFAILEMMKKITKDEPKMWGPSIVGFGKYHYKYESGREGEMCITGFSPRKQYEAWMKELGKHTTGKSCLYIKRLEDVDMKVLKELVASSFKYMKEKYN